MLRFTYDVTASCTLPNVASGHTIVVAAAGLGAASSVTFLDNCGGRYATSHSNVLNGQVAGQGYSLTGSHGTCVVTANTSAGSWATTLVAEEISGAAVASEAWHPFARLAAGGQLSLSTATGSADYVFSWMADAAANGGGGVVAAPFVVEDQDQSFPIADADLIQTTAGTATATWTFPLATSYAQVGMIAFRSAAPDTSAPSVPNGLGASPLSASQIYLQWTASTDPDNAQSQITYHVYRNGTAVATTPAGEAFYSDSGLTASTSYTYAVSASDPAGNTSAKSAAVSATTLASGGGGGRGLHVSVNQLLDQNNNLILLHGVDRAGTEYACVEGWGIFDTTINVLEDDEQVPFMKAWKVTSVVIGLNEDCWLGINGVPAAFGGTNYIKAIKHEVATLESYGIYPILSLFWNAPGTQQANYQREMPDNDHSPQFWQSVANKFKNNPNVVFRLKEEPFPGGATDAAAWGCWNAGDVQYGATGSLNPISKAVHCSDGYTEVGMQSLVNIIRGTGATNVIQVPGIAYANDLSQFLAPAYRIVDTLNPPQLMADTDIYPNGNACGTVSCYNSTLAPVAAVMPLNAGEIGESVDGTDPSTAQVDSLIGWLDSHGASYQAWTWDAWGPYLSLITDYTSGTPTTGWGVDYKNHLATAPAVAASKPQISAPQPSSAATTRTSLAHGNGGKYHGRRR